MLLSVYESDGQAVRNVLVVDGHPIVRVGLCHLVNAFYGFRVAATAASRTEAIAELRDNQIDVVMTSLALGASTDGLRFVQDVRKKWPAIPILVVSGQKEEKQAMLAFQSGAGGYIQKDAPPEKILAALKSVSSGGAYFSRRVGTLIITRLKEVATKNVNAQDVA